MTVTSKEEKDHLREGGKRLARVLEELTHRTRPGITTAELNRIAEQLIREGGDVPSFLHYQPDSAHRPFPSAICISVNDEIVHGIPSEHSIELKDGDIVSFDVGVTHKGLITDAAITVPVGNIDRNAEKLINTTREALAVGIKAARAGNTSGDIGYAIEEFVKPYGYGIPVELGGHGVGRKVHEDPDISNYGKKGEGDMLHAGMVIAIEPMLNEGSSRISFDNDGYTVRTADGSRSAHFEHTVLITDGDPEILTKE